MSGLEIFLIVLFSVILVLLVTYLFIGIFAYRLSVSRKAIVGKKILKHLNSNIADYKIDRKWWNSQNVERLETRADGETLVGFLIHSLKKSSKVAIVVHGYSVNHKDVNAQAEIFLRNGFNVFAPDLRAHGESTGKTIGMGSFDKTDIMLWINKMIEIFGKNTEIVLFGISMGGATVCMVSGENIKNVKCIVSDCAYSDLNKQLKYILKERYGAPSFPVINIASTFINLIGKYKIKDVNPVSAVAKSKTPILFIHGKADELVPYFMVEDLYSASNKKLCELYSVKNAKHAQCFASNPEEYENKMMSFVGKYLNKNKN